MTPYFFENQWLSLNDLVTFSFDLSPKASNLSISTENRTFQMRLCTIFLFEVRNSLLGASMRLERLSPKAKNYILTQSPHNFGPKCGLSPNDPIFFKFFSHPMPLGAKTGALHLYRFHIYEWPPPPRSWPCASRAYLAARCDHCRDSRSEAKCGLGEAELLSHQGRPSIVQARAMLGLSK